MKKLLIVLAVLVLLPMSATAAEIQLDSDYLIGTVIPGTPSQPADEALRLTYLIDLYNGVPGVIPPLEDKPHAYWLNASVVGDFGVLPSPAVFSTKHLDGWIGWTIEGISGSTFTLPSGYDYLAAKFGPNTAYFYIGGLSAGDDLLLSAAWVQNANMAQDFGTQGLSHVSLFNATTVVPEPASMLLLGTGLLGLVAAARRRR